MTIYSDALGKQSTFNTNLIAKLQELATAVGNRVRSADLYDGNGKIKSNLLPFAINDLLEMKGALTLQSYPYQITSGSGSKDGEIYIVTEAATGLTIDDITEVKIGDWVLFIDGKWVPCDRLPMQGTLIHLFEEPPARKSHSVRLTLTDACGNTACWEGTIRR